MQIAISPQLSVQEIKKSPSVDPEFSSVFVARRGIMLRFQGLRPKITAGILHFSFNSVDPEFSVRFVAKQQR